MKRYVYPAALVLAIAVLSRLPHPARDISKLDPVRTVYCYMEGDILHMETDTGDHGAGLDLDRAAKRMKAEANKEIYLETAEFLLLDPEVPVDGAFYRLLRPSAKVCYVTQRPDLKTATQYLDVHSPEITLAQLRAELEAAAP